MDAKRQVCVPRVPCAGNDVCHLLCVPAHGGGARRLFGVRCAERHLHRAVPPTSWPSEAAACSHSLLPFGAEEFDHDNSADRESKASFFSWLYLCVDFGPIVSGLLITWI
ncbi:unnamed protein product [Miscanthus lutarioriparius]|uniref:Uncharacterized protein n=1 Tax=Miscanthus lutarioriparius TaxID=422564 RepID=A0A811QJC6_9POAL|nr:unnamed protein product [Miscanthus lutarioriparius]